LSSHAAQTHLRINPRPDRHGHCVRHSIRALRACRERHGCRFNQVGQTCPQRVQNGDVAGHSSALSSTGRVRTPVESDRSERCEIVPPHMLSGVRPPLAQVRQSAWHAISWEVLKTGAGSVFSGAPKFEQRVPGRRPLSAFARRSRCRFRLCV
jgi:hypothetical protein